MTLVDWDPDAEDKLLAAICYPHANLPEQSLLDRVRRLGADDRVALDTRLRRRSTESTPQAGPGVRARRVPIRRVVRLRRVPRPATASPADDRVAATHPVPRIRPTRPDRRSGARRAVRFGDGAVGRTPRRAADGLSRTGLVRGGDGLPAAVRHAVQRARGDPPARAALVGTGTSGVPAGGARDAPSDRRPSPVITRSPMRWCT